MKLRNAFAGLGFAVAMLASATPSYAQDELTCSNGSYEDHQTGMYADIGFDAYEHCTSGQGNLYVVSTSWGAGYSGQWTSGLTFWQIGLGQETITVTVSDGYTTTSFDWVVYRYGY